MPTSTRTVTQRAMPRFRAACLAVAAVLTAAPAAAQLRAGPIPVEGRLALDRIRGAHFHLAGLPGDRVKANVDRWLTAAPKNNPGLLEMFARRDEGGEPNLVPWAGEFVGKYLISGVQALRMSDDPKLQRDPARRGRSPLPLAGRRRLPRPLAQSRPPPRPVGPVGTLSRDARADDVARAHRRQAGRRGRSSASPTWCATRASIRVSAWSMPVRTR